MKTYQVVKLGDVLKRNTKQIRIEDNQKYKQVTVRLWGKGVQLRNEVYGHEIKSDSRYIVKSGQFIISKIDARNGASGLIPEELDGAVITGDFLSFDINKDLILPEYLLWLSRTEWFIEQCVQASSGTTNRIRLNESKFLQIEISLPNISEQAQIIRKIQDAVQIINNIDLVLTEQKQLTENLRQSILQKAIQGHLVEQDPNDEPAAELLKRIREEKERLTKEKKIKKEKPLPPISPEEIPYELPKGWEWVRLGEITSVQGGKRVPKGYTLLDEPTDHVYIRVSDMKNGTIMTNDLKYISDEVYETIKDYTISKDDLYITIAGTIGQVGTVPDELDGMNLTENAAKIIVVLANKHYLKYVLRSNLLQQQFIDKVNQVAQPKLALKRIKMAVIPLPPIDEQLRIVNKIEEMLYAVELLEMNYVDEAQEFKRLMQVMLAEAFQNRYS